MKAQCKRILHNRLFLISKIKSLPEDRLYNGTVITVLDFKTPLKTVSCYNEIIIAKFGKKYKKSEILKKIRSFLIVLRPLQTVTCYN